MSIRKFFGARRRRRRVGSSGGSGRQAVRDRFADLAAILDKDSPTIVDAGAAKGRVLERFLADYKSPVVHAFEPIPEYVDRLRERFGEDPCVHVHPVALGAEATTATFRVAKTPVTSSLLAPTDIARGYQGEKVEVERTIEVEQVRLDSRLQGPVDLLKLDLQGYELQALRGAEGLLGELRAITLEVEFVPLYEGQPLFAELDQYLRSHGFRLLNLYELFTHEDGQLTSGDATYLNQAFFGPSGGVPS